MYINASFRQAPIRNLFLLFLTLGWLIFIFSNSLRDGIESGQQSKQLLRILQELLQTLGYRGTLSEHFLRKLAHFGEFAILAFLLCLDLWSLSLFTFSHTPSRVRLVSALSLPLCFLVAVTDEFLQRFTPGRGSRFTDTLIDTAGGLCAYLFFLAFFFLLRLIRRRTIHKS